MSPDAAESNRRRRALDRMVEIADEATTSRTSTTWTNESPL